MLLQSFPQFSRLPTELRCYVWRLALQQPRVHRLRIANDSEKPFTLQPTETLPRSTITTRTILATCQESRIEALRAVPDVLPLGNSLLRFNGSEDVFCLVKVNLDVLDEVSKTLAKCIPPGLHDGSSRPADEAPRMNWVESVTQLALETRSTAFNDDFGFSLKGELISTHVPKFMTIFSMLKWFFLVTLPSPDVMTTITCGGGHSVADIVGEADQDEVEYDHDDDGDEEEGTQDTRVNSTDGDKTCGLTGSGWIRGESGISDWYRCLPRCTTWDHSNEVAEEHFYEVAICAEGLQASLRPPSHMLDLSPMERRALESVGVRAVAHFREGVEPPSEL